jgi:hypothetical protein
MQPPLPFKLPYKSQAEMVGSESQRERRCLKITDERADALDA